MKRMTNIMLWATSFLFIAFTVFGIVSAGGNRWNDRVPGGPTPATSDSTQMQSLREKSIKDDASFQIAKVVQNKNTVDIYFRLSSVGHIPLQVKSVSVSRHGQQGKLHLIIKEHS